MQVRPFTPDDQPELARLCWAYRDLLVERTKAVPGLIDTYYSQDDYTHLIAELPRIHARPRGDILLAEHAGAVVGCGMYYPLEQPGLCEIKRVFVDPSARGLGAASAIFDAAMAGAKADGYERMILDTMIELTEAIALYEKLGFAPCDAFYDLDPRFKDVIRFFDRAL